MLEKLKKIFSYFFIGFSFLASKKIVAILEVTLFLALVHTSLAKNEFDNISSNEIIKEKVEESIRSYQDGVFDEKNSDVAVEKLIQCYQKKIDENNYSLEMKNYLEDLESLFKENEEHFSFLYQDLYSSFTVSYREDAPIFTASTIKAPAMIYLFEEASQGNIDLDDELVYTDHFYHGGSGILQNMPKNTSYKVGTLIEYAIRDSDNIAYHMLIEHYGRKNILSFWSNKGTQHIFTQDTIWGITSASDAAIYMKELYQFYRKNSEYGSKLFSYFQESSWKMISDKNGKFLTASKGGWSGKAFHDVAIVLDKNPYLLIVMSNTGEGNYDYLFQKASYLAGKFHESYWRYKEESCNEIKQY